MKHIIFDVGEVLLEYRWKEMLTDDYELEESYANRLGIQIFEDSLWKDFDANTAAKEEIIRQYEQKYPEDAKHIRWFIEHGELMKVARPDVWERVHKLKQAGYQIYLLFNYSEDLFTKHTKDAPFLKDIDGMVVSYQVHLLKPDMRIYQCLCDKYELEPENCIFFDDRQENVDAANTFGMEAYTVTSKEYLLEQLDSLLEM